MKLLISAYYRNSQYYLELVLNICMFYFLAFFSFETILLTLKLTAYDIEQCMIDTVPNTTVIQNSSTIIDSLRHSCWAYGSKQKVYLEFQRKISVVKMQLSEGIPAVVAEFGHKERIFNRHIAFFAYCLFILQVILFVVQKKVNFHGYLIEQLKHRKIIDYSAIDIQHIGHKVVDAIKYSMRSFVIELIIKFFYCINLLVSIIMFKLILIGQHSLNNLDFDSLIVFPSIETFEPRAHDYYPLFKVPTYQMLPKFLHELFNVLWIIFLVLLAVFTILMIIKFVRYQFKSLRTKSILAWAPGVDEELLMTINKYRSNYHFLSKVARNIDSTYFSLMIDNVLEIKPDSEGRSNVVLNQHVESSSIENVSDHLNSHQMQSYQVKSDDVCLNGGVSNEKHSTSNFVSEFRKKVEMNIASQQQASSNVTNDQLEDHSNLNSSNEKKEIKSSNIIKLEPILEFNGVINDKLTKTSLSFHNPNYQQHAKNKSSNEKPNVLQETKDNVTIVDIEQVDNSKVVDDVKIEESKVEENKIEESKFAEDSVGESNYEYVQIDTKSYDSGIEKSTETSNEVAIQMKDETEIQMRTDNIENKSIEVKRRRPRNN